MLSQETPTDQAQTDVRTNRPRDGAAEVPPHAPNLVVIGAMKASTTSFYELVTRHPEIWFSSEKEPHYFTSPEYGEPAAWNRYLKLFEPAPKSAEYIGEASTGYSKLPHFGDTPQRLREDLAEPRFIYLVRDPVARTISNYQHSYLNGHFAAGTTLAEAIERDPILIDASCYARQISAYRSVFGADKLLIITTDELHSHQTRTMRRVEEFLGLSAFDGWDAPLPQSNSQQSLGRSLAWQAMLPRPVYNVLRSLVPAKLKGSVKSLASSKVTVPPIADDERNLVFERISEDLVELHKLLGDAIDSWPSVQKLGER